MQLECRPEDVGLDPVRLQRVTAWGRAQVESARLPGVITALVRRGRLAHFAVHGLADVEAGTPLRADSVFRIYSMTKPVVTVAALMLYEEGHFQLDDPLHAFVPAFAGTGVYAGGGVDAFRVRPPARPISVRDLMTHTSGMTYGFMGETEVDRIYRARGLSFNDNRAPLAALVEALAGLPLLFDPGTRWNYGVSTDVLGRLVEIWSGQPLDRFLAERVFEPLGMVDTGFQVHADARPRFTSNYQPGENGGLALLDAAPDSRFTRPAATFSGGGGLVSTAADYLRFARLLLGRGADAGVRLLGRKTAELMSANHLGTDMAGMGQPRFSETTYEGIGFGLGVSVMLDPARACIVGSPGEFAWGGMASTAFWVDPVEDLTALLLTQLTPSSTYPLRRELRVLTYQAIVD